MNRRDFSALSLASGLALSAPQLSFAQGGPVEGINYRRLSNPLPTSPGKIEVNEFFWYGCPHCYAFDPVLTAWVKRLPADVVFRRMHVGKTFHPRVGPHQKLFLALEALGKEGALHEAVFNAFQVQRLELDDDDQVIDLAVKLGVNRATFTQMYNSFGINAKMAEIDKQFVAYGMDGVPSLSVGGRYWTSPSMAGPRGMSEQELGVRALAILDELIQRVRSGR